MEEKRTEKARGKNKRSAVCKAHERWCAFERVPNEQEMRKALEEKEAVSEEAERKEFQGEGGLRWCWGG